MRTIETTVTVEPNGQLVFLLPPDIAPGEHRVALVIEEQPAPVEKSLPPAFPVLEVSAWPENLSLSREALYDDFGR